MTFSKSKKILSALFAVLASVVVWKGCRNAVLLNPQGWIGAQTKSLILTALFSMSCLVLPVVVASVCILHRFRASNNARYQPGWSHSHTVEVATWSVPALVVAFLSVLTWRSTHALDPRRPIGSEDRTLTIQVVSLDWKWLFIYPQYNVATINEVCFPINTPLRFRVTSDSVMNSFFIPQLGSQVYAMAGMSSTLHLVAESPGVYRGFSSSFSGEGFSGMKFDAVATQRGQFHRWIQRVQASRAELTQARYKRLAKPSVFRSVKYFARIDPVLFERIIRQYQQHRLPHSRHDAPRLDQEKSSCSEN